ncbi:DUF6249 domain-containing protein [Ascidiimonas aurantiaca]|uniref:DUF6249 domain-containing protein n=1 Tax=Ascidiimonas aurantiaca TaxID=1685432 RepID=UPI0030EE85BC
MPAEVIIFVSLFLVIFGIFYLHYSTRNKERLALIEKGADASIFVSSRKRATPSFWKILILNLSLLLMGIGIGVFVGSIVHYGMGVDEEIAYPGTLFLMAGIGLFTGFKLSKNLS